MANQPRGTQRHRAIRREDEGALTQEIVQLASQYGRYGYRRITALLKRAGIGRWAKTGWSVSGVARGSRFRRSRSHEDGCGSTMVHACGSGRHIATMCGATTSSARGRMMAAAYGSST